MDDLISREASIRIIKNAKYPKTDIRTNFDLGRNAGLEFASVIVEGLPTAEPKIVRCKDCKHWIPYDWMFSEVWQSKNIADYPEDEIDCEWSEMSMKANDFCSRAERRKDG